MQVTSEGSVRVDLVGGTLDLEPINLILPNVVTLNVATGLKAKVTLDKTDADTVVIQSEDYDKTYTFKKEDFTQEKLIQDKFFGEMSFVCQILDAFNIHSKIKLTLRSGAPAGSGLGGSSAMGITLYKALCEYTGKKIDVTEAVYTVKGVEGRILNQGIPGYQDYYPALLGGVLCLRGEPGRIVYEQLYTPELKTFLEEHVTLVYSGISRQSGINNWDVYKAFFDGNERVRAAMGHIAEVSYQAYKAIKNNEFQSLLKLIGDEGKSRERLAAGIVPYEIQEFYVMLMHELNHIGLKMCGAGGGGCFILTHQKDQKDKLLQLVEKAQMKVLDFTIESPLQ
jgi:D-glycero-alpha-D-manno-heptose-7-phosphate kinase